MKKGLKRNNGITLIALVITIIVLLILAGVSIAMLAGENGILKQAARAKEQTERAKAEEAAQLAYLAAIMEDEDATQETLKGKVKEELEKQGYEVKEVTTDQKTVQDITLSKESLEMEPDAEPQNVEITLTFNTDSSSKLYVKINNKYYEITIDEEGAQIADTETNIDNANTETDESQVSMKVEKDTIIDAKLTKNTSTSYTLQVTPKAEGTTNVTLTVNNTNIIKTLSVTVKKAKPTLAEFKNEQRETPVSENTTLKDTNGDKITIPEHFNLASDSPTEVEQGIVIEDSEDNQYVWIPVFKKSDTRDWGVDYSSVTSREEYDKITTALKEYTKTYANSSYSDTWCSGCGNMDQSKYTKLYNDMLDSVYTNEGFYIGRYEMGTKVVSDVSEFTDKNGWRTSEPDSPSSIDGMLTPISQANAIPYIYITQAQAEQLVEKLEEKTDYEKVTTSIMFGVEWDAVCVFIEHCDNKDPSQIKSNSTSWGNYACGSSTFKLDRGFYNVYNSSFGGWKAKDNTQKQASNKWLYTTGAVDRNRSLNIYDFAGNLSEWTLERSSLPCTYRGYCFGTANPSPAFASVRTNSDTSNSSFSISSRPHFFISSTES